MKTLEARAYEAIVPAESLPVRSARCFAHRSDQ